MNKLLNALPLLATLAFFALIFLVARGVDRRAQASPRREHPPRRPQLNASEASLEGFRRSFARRR
ncbi:hypothetical protein [Hyalangium sp.]|uniref:hypothetical protein n=1 Tax=Hyalangium sp. TaxID=2028555 RepID=UPI002D3ABA54|nr:hypothetical protein [Hyalangium sp.]HYI01694.1 hypothetical protein [Hyalangium sp.]